MEDNSALFTAYFQTYPDYYLNKLRKFDAGSKLSFNVSAFIFGIFWFIYRKMYVEAIVIGLFLIIEGMLTFKGMEEQLFLKNKTSPLTNAMIALVTLFVLGFAGNYLYIRKAKRIVQKARLVFQDKDDVISFLHKKGGITYVFIPVFLILAVLRIFYYVYLFNKGGHFLGK